MSARDIFHQAVCSALIKEGWSITHDPLTLEFEEVTLFVDLGAERLIAVQRGIEKIAVEIKTFLRDSLVTELHLTIGQLLNYRLALLESEPERILYLAVPKELYENFFSVVIPKELFKLIKLN